MSKTKEKSILTDFLRAARSYLKEKGYPSEEIDFQKNYRDDYILTIEGIAELSVLLERVELSKAQIKTIINIRFSGNERLVKVDFKEDTDETVRNEVAEAFENDYFEICEKIERDLNEKLAALESKDVPEVYKPETYAKIKKNYKMTESLGDVEKWEAKIFLANNQGNRPGIGEMGQVGYTMISLDTGMIVPVAISDQHNCGHDLIRYFIEKRLIKSEDFYPIYYCNNYVDSDKPQEVIRSLKAFKLWRQMGGSNTIVSGTGSLCFRVTMDDYIRLEGKISQKQFKKENKLLPAGGRIIERFELIAKSMNQFRAGKRIKEDKVFKTAQDLLTEVIEMFRFTSGIEKVAKAGLTEISSTQSLEKLELILFGHSGIKNTLHMQLKGLLESKGGYHPSEKELSEVFGDIELAYSEFTRLGRQY